MLHRRIRVSVTGVLAAALSAGVAPASAATAGAGAAQAGAASCHAVHRITLPKGTDSTFGITFGSGGVYVAVGQTIDRVRHGHVRKFALPHAARADAGWLAWDGHSKRIWFADRGTPHIGTLGPDGTIHEVRIPAGPGGNQSVAMSLVLTGNRFVWFSDQNNNRLGRYNRATHHFRFWTVPTGDPLGLTRGGDGDLYFVERSPAKVGRLDPKTGLFTEWTLPNGAFPNRIVTAPNGDVWFTELLVPRIARIDSSGHLRQWKLAGGPVGVAYDGGNLYTALFTGGGVAQVNQHGHVTRRWALPRANGPLQIAARGHYVYTGASKNLYQVNTSC